MCVTCATIAAVPCAMSGETSETLTYTWDYDAERPADLQFLLFMRDDNGDYDYLSPVAVIDYDEKLGLTGTSEFNISGVPGEDVTKFFVIRAKTGGETSGNSNEASYTFTIPIQAPFSFSIKINLVTR